MDWCSNDCESYSKLVLSLSHLIFKEAYFCRNVGKCVAPFQAVSFENRVNNEGGGYSDA